MRITIMFYAFELMKPADSPSSSYRPLYLERMPCGFPSPCQNYAEQELDLNEYLVTHRAIFDTPFVRNAESTLNESSYVD